MGFAVSQLTVENLSNIQTDCEYQLTLVMNQLQMLSTHEAAITAQQMAYSQSYIEQSKDEEGTISDEMIEWVNSSAFNAQFEKKLQEIQVKEQLLDIQKQQIETKQKMATTQIEGWEKNRDSYIEDIFKYGN